MVTESYWLRKNGKPLRLFSDQVIIHVTEVNGISKVATFKIDNGAAEMVFLEKMKITDREPFEFGNYTYIVEVMGFREPKKRTYQFGEDFEVNISIIRRIF